MEFIELTYNKMEEEAAELGASLPMEQTEAWSRLERRTPGRTSWGVFRVEQDGEAVAFIALFDYRTHAYHYLRAAHGPVWVAEPTPELERAFLEALTEFVRKRDRRQVFVRLAVACEETPCEPVLSTIPYNQTVIMDLNEDEEAMLQGLKPRGRRDVRKALRESPATYADETERATASFNEYYDVMVETAERDDFIPAPIDTYTHMIHELGPEHCRVFAGRIDDKVVTWTIATVNGSRAVRYYGASRTDIPHRSFVTDGLVFFESCVLAKRGCTTYDMMGIGNDFAPSLKGLNTFKTKFSKNVVDIAPDRDLPLKPLVYASLVKARQILRRNQVAIEKGEVNDAHEEAKANQDLRQRMAVLTNTNAEDWYLVSKARQGMQVALAAASSTLSRKEVVTQLFTCVTAVNPILAAGLEPRYAEVSESTLALDADALELTDAICAVMLTHTFGIVDAASSQALADATHEAGAVLVEDSAHCVCRMACDAAGEPVADVSIHSFGVEKILQGTYFGGAVWVNPKMKNAKVAKALRAALKALPTADKSLGKAARAYRNQVRILTRAPHDLSNRLRQRWEGSGAYEPAVSDAERRGETNHEPSVPTAWMCEQAFAAIEDLGPNERNRRACVAAYKAAFSDDELRALGVPEAACAGVDQPLLRFPVFATSEEQACAVAKAVIELGFYVPSWPRPLLVPGVLDPVPYGLAEGTAAWPVSERLSANVVALPTDIDPAQIPAVVAAVRATMGSAQPAAPVATAANQEATMPQNLALIKGREDLAERLQPVVCGADILGYAYVRCYYEAYGIRPIVLSAIDVKVTSSSKFCDYRIVPELNDEEGFVKAVSALGAELAAQGKVGILHGSADWNTRIISAHKDEFSSWYVVPYIDFELLDSITQKERFYELCEELDIAYPQTWYVDCANKDAEVDVNAFPYPLIAKPSNSAAYDLLDFAGKEKIYEIETPERLAEVIRIVRGSGYAHKLILQDFVPGGDDAIRSLTTFSDADGNVRVVSGGQVVLQDHSPLALGNPVCILGEKVDRIVEDAAKFLKRVGYHGYANMDIKYDERDGSYRFFEINTRPGKNTFYVTLGGMNFVVPIVEDWVLGNEVPYTEAYEPFLYTVVPPKVISMSVPNEELREKALAMFRTHQAHNPHDYAPDSPLHKMWAELAYRHQVSKFKAYL